MDYPVNNNMQASFVTLFHQPFKAFSILTRWVVIVIDCVARAGLVGHQLECVEAQVMNVIELIDQRLDSRVWIELITSAIEGRRADLRFIYQIGKVACRERK